MIFSDYKKLSQKICERFERYGCVVIESSLSIGALKELNSQVLDCFASVEKKEYLLSNPAWKSVINRGAFSNQIFSNYLNKTERFNIRRILNLLKRGGLNDLFKKILDDEDIYMIPELHFRIKHGVRQETAIPFHQHFIQGDNVEKAFLLAVSIPFKPYDSDHPRMEIVARNTPQKVPTTTPVTNFPELELDHNFVVKNYSEYLWSPHLDIGSVFIFRETNIHRTLIDSSMKNVRTSVDIRIFSGTHAPERFDRKSAIRL